MTRTALLSTCAVLASLTVFANGEALAQTVDAPAAIEAQAGEEIIVTGSRIRRDPLNQTSPVVRWTKHRLPKPGFRQLLTFYSVCRVRLAASIQK